MAKSDKKQMDKAGPAGGIYLMGFVGSAVYFLDIANGFWEVILGLLKAAVWPAFLINRVFELLRI